MLSNCVVIHIERSDILPNQIQTVQVEDSPAWLLGFALKTCARFIAPLRRWARPEGLSRADAKGSKQPKTQIPALDGLTLEVQPAEIFGLLGPNGAGKSTTIGVLTTRVRPTSGQAWIGEHDVWKEQAAVKRLIGVVPQRPNLDFSLTAREILVFHGAYFGLASKLRNERADSLLEKFKLTERGSQMVRGFSGGMMQRFRLRVP